MIDQSSDSRFLCKSAPPLGSDIMDSVVHVRVEGVPGAPLPMCGSSCFGRLQLDTGCTGNARFPDRYEVEWIIRRPEATVQVSVCAHRDRPQEP
jgi:hypothetical protein